MRSNGRQCACPREQGHVDESRTSPSCTSAAWTATGAWPSAVSALPTARSPRNRALPLDRIKLPPGFAIEHGRARAERARDDVGHRGHAVRRIRRGQVSTRVTLPRAGARRAGGCASIASGLREPAGVAFRDGALYVAGDQPHPALRRHRARGSTHPPDAGRRHRRASRRDGHHGRKFIALRSRRQALRAGRRAVQRLRRPIPTGTRSSRG